MKKVIIFLILILNSYSIFSQVKVYFTNNSKLEGIINYETLDSLKLITQIGEEHSIEKNLIKNKIVLNSEITLKNGSLIIGHIYSIDDDSNITILVNNDLSNVIKIKKSDIIYIEFQNKLKDYFNSLGFTLGTPGPLNLIVGANYYNFGIRGILGFGNGYQFNFIYNLYDGESIETGFSLGIGYFEYESTRNSFFGPTKSDLKQITFYGPFYHLNFYGVMIEAGLGYGEGNLGTPQGFFQLGYVHRFNIY